MEWFFFAIFEWPESEGFARLCPVMISTNAPRFLSPITAQRRQRPLGRLKPNPKGTLRQQVHEVMRFFHYSDRTEETYWQWIVRYLRFHRRKGLGVSREGAMGKKAEGVKTGKRESGKAGCRAKGAKGKVRDG